jgi:hypothetical protein
MEMRAFRGCGSVQERIAGPMYNAVSRSLSCQVRPGDHIVVLDENYEDACK